LQAVGAGFVGFCRSAARIRSGVQRTPALAA